jgi:quercetin dioxygenase-like cupin family protein/DNA-binding XRE family transcriptional regulator
VDEKTIGASIRRLRTERGLSLTDAAKSASLTKSALSKIETGQISAPISTMLRIADALKVPLAEFFSEGRAQRNFALTRKGAGTPIVRDGTQFGYAYEALALAMPNKRAEPFLLTIAPGDPKGHFQHDGQEFIYMLSGKLEFSVGEETMVLEPGDSIYFDPNLPHSSRAVGKSPAKYLCVFVQQSENGSPTRKRGSVSG